MLSILIELSNQLIISLVVDAIIDIIEKQAGITLLKRKKKD